MLAALADHGLAALPRSSTWLTGIVNVVEAATARSATPTWPPRPTRCSLPYADRPVMPSLAVTCFGSVERALGLAASTMGELDRAVDHLERASKRTAASATCPWSPSPGVISPPSCSGGIAAATETGRSRRGAGRRPTARRWGWLAGPPAGGSRPTRPADHAEVTLRRDDGEWLLDVGGRSIVLGDLVGVGYLATLLARPAAEIPALELCGGVDVEATFQPMIDADALRAYRQRVATIDEQLARGPARRAAAQVERLGRERDELRRELSAVLGRAGRARRFVDPAERARTAVRKAIARALDLIEGVEPSLAAELRATVSTGRTCAFRPGTGRGWRVMA